MTSADAVKAGAPGLTITGTAQHSAWQSRQMPPVEEIGSGIWSIPVPFPDNPLRYTLTYVVPGSAGVVVVDPGWCSDSGWESLRAGLHTAGAAVNDVIGIVVTHIHPDHHGLSGQLREASGAWIAMHPEERNTLPGRLAEAGDEVGKSREYVLRLLDIVGAPEEEVASTRLRFDNAEIPRLEDLAMPDLELADGDLVPCRGRDLHAVWTPGHTPGHLCLREPNARVLLTGDHVLPRITPNIGMWERGSPLRSFLTSLDSMAAYDDHEALPAHEYRFRGLAARAAQLQAHHLQRCREILDAVAEIGMASVWQVAERLVWSRPWEQVGQMRVAALSETMAHVAHLVEEHELVWLRGRDMADAEYPVLVRIAG